MTNIEDILANIDSKLRKNLKTGSDFTAERLELPSIGLTKALGGGLPYGRIVTIHGSKSAGKSSLMLQAIPAAQAQGKICAWIDAEKTFDSKWGQRMGVNTDDLLVSRASDMHRAGDEAKALIQAGVDLLVIDSISALIQPSYLDRDGEIGGMDKTQKIGDFSKGLKAMMRSINYVNDNTLVVFISQQTTHIAQTYTKNVPEGGKAVEYYSSQVIKLNSPASKVIEKTVDVGNKSYTGAVGREVDWTIDFNKVGPAGGTGTYEFYYLGDSVGVDQRLEVLHIALEQGVAERRGAWYYIGEEKFQGADAAIEWLADDDNFKSVKDELT